ncbi:MAG: hypothetical protein QM751_03060 [Paludibacteraceae bacterium]
MPLTKVGDQKLDGTLVLNWYNLDPEYVSDYLSPQSWVYPKNDISYFFKIGVANTNNISVSKSTDKSSFRVSLTNKNVTGTIPNSSLSKNSVSISGNVDGKVVSFFGSANYLETNSTGQPLDRSIKPKHQFLKPISGDKYRLIIKNCRITNDPMALHVLGTVQDMPIR